MTTANPTVMLTGRYCRAPRGGITIGGRHFKGGQFCFNAPADPIKPAKLVGSSRQVAWATRLRAERIAAAESRTADLLLGLATIQPAQRSMYRPSLMALATERHRFATETSASAIIAMARA